MRISKNIHNITKIISVIAIIFCFTTLNVSAFITGSAGIDDKASLYHEAQIAELEALQEQVALSTGWNIAVVTTNTGFGTGGSKAIDYAENYYYDTFGKGTAGVLYLIDLDYRHIVVEGDAELYFNDNRLRAILNETEKLYKDYDDVGNLEAFYKNIEYYYSKGYYTNDTGGKVTLYPDNYNYDYESEKGNLNFLIGVILGLVAAAIGIIVVYSKYKLHHVPTANNYVQNGSVNFYRRNDRFIREFTTRVRVNDDSNHSGGGGGGGSHHSSGGHHSGGGGSGGRR